MAIFSAIDSGTLHYIPAASRSTAWTVNDTSVTSSWETADLSAIVPNGTKAVYGHVAITSSAGGVSVLFFIREGGSASTDNEQIVFFRNDNRNGAGDIIGSPAIIMLGPSRTFDYSEGANIGTFTFALKGYYI